MKNWMHIALNATKFIVGNTTMLEKSITIAFMIVLIEFVQMDIRE